MELRAFLETPYSSVLSIDAVAFFVFALTFLYLRKLHTTTFFKYVLARSYTVVPSRPFRTMYYIIVKTIPFRTGY
jgi:hypothetical protein